MYKRSLSMLLGAAALAISAALAPIVVLVGSSPAHADPDVWDPCSVQGAKIGTTHGALECMRLSGHLRWMQIEPEVSEKPPGYPAGSCRPSADPPPHLMRWCRRTVSTTPCPTDRYSHAMKSSRTKTR